MWELWGQAVYKWRYWIDQSQNCVEGSCDGSLHLDIDVNGLSKTLHQISIQVCDTAGVFSEPVTKLFLVPEEEHDKYDEWKLHYWFDKNSEDLRSVETPQGLFDLEVSELSTGLHCIHFLATNKKGTNAEPTTRFFFIPEQEQDIDKDSKLHYWFDQNNETLYTIDNPQGIFDIDATSLPIGIHLLHCFVTNSHGEPSEPIHKVFAKVANTDFKLKYWFDNDTTQIYETKFVSGIQMMDVSAIDDGEHTLNLLVVDEDGIASEVVTAVFIKEGGDIRILIVKRHYTDEDIAKAQQNPNILVVKWENGETLPLSIRNGMNPNLITYVEDGVEIEGGFKNSRNVVQNGKANELVLTDRSPLLITEPFTASKAQYTRHFEKETTIGDAAGWESIVLPYPVQKITTEDGRTLAPFGSPIPADVNFWLGRMVNDGFEHATKILANVPYVIAVPNSNSYRDEYNVEGNVTFTSTSVKVHATDEETANYSIFKPTYEEAADYADLYAINDDEYDAHPAGSVFVRGLRAIRPFEGYITKDFVGGAAPRTIIPIMNNDETGIVDITRKPGNGKVYSIDGRRVNGSTLSTGLYIINGRKVVVK